MFKGQSKTDIDSSTGSKDTVIASGVKVEGDFNSEGNLIIEGEVIGNLKTSMDIFAGTDSKIVASVVSRNARISGTLEGNISASDRLELTETARVTGDVQAKVLVVEPGAVLNGKCSMGAHVSKSVSEEQEQPSKAIQAAQASRGLKGGRAVRSA